MSSLDRASRLVSEAAIDPGRVFIFFYIENENPPFFVGVLLFTLGFLDRRGFF